MLLITITTITTIITITNHTITSTRTNYIIRTFTVIIIEITKYNKKKLD